MNQNLGKLDRILRFALAFWWLGPWKPEYDLSSVNLAIAVLGWIALTESFLGWCWFHTLLRINNKNQ